MAEAGGQAPARVGAVGEVGSGDVHDTASEFHRTPIPVRRSRACHSWAGSGGCADPGRVRVRCGVRVRRAACGCACRSGTGVGPGPGRGGTAWDRGARRAVRCSAARWPGGSPPCRPGRSRARRGSSSLSAPREAEVLDLVARGHDDRRITREPVVAEKTVRNHVTHVFEELYVATRGGGRPGPRHGARRRLGPPKVIRGCRSADRHPRGLTWCSPPYGKPYGCIS
ncbi:helix-turn-helix transcriptional regulator [Kitasatospora sp. NPDC004669]|uniref:response regulator transcription factor n=1 Tax=Kitasatospora sp. NPDC004669 TaxID=3154555 RepID=UPI0033A7375D